MSRSPAPQHPPGYGWIVPITLGAASLWLFATSAILLDRNSGCEPMDPAIHGRVVDYIEDTTRSEGHVLQVRLYSAAEPFAVVTTRDDRPWRTFAPGEEVHLLLRTGRTANGHPTLDYVVDDFAAKWGELLARVFGAVICNIAAVAWLVLSRRRPSAARRFPPAMPRMDPARFPPNRPSRVGDSACSSPET